MSVCKRTYHELSKFETRAFLLVLRIISGEGMEKLRELTWRTEYRDVFLLAGQLSGVKMRVYARGCLGCPSTFENIVSTGKLDDNLMTSAANENSLEMRSLSAWVEESVYIKW